MQPALVSKEDVLPEQQERSPSLHQKGSGPRIIKEEQEELWESRDAKELHGLGEADVTTFPFAVVAVKSEDEEKPQSSRFHQSQRDASTEVELLAGSSAEQRTLKTEADEEDCGGSQPASDSGPCSPLQAGTDDMQQVLVSKEAVRPEQQEWSPSLDQKGSEPPNIKEEQEELWVSQEGKQLHGLGEADVTKSSFTVVSAKSNDEEKPRSFQLHQSQRDVSTEMELLAGNWTEHRTLKIEADEEDCGGSQPASDSGPCSPFQPDTDDMQQLLIKEEFLPEQQEWNLSVDQEDMKEEQETLWRSQQGQQLHQLEEDDITEFPFTVVHVMSESDDERPQSSRVHQSQLDESGKAEPVASSSVVHRTLTAQADGEDYGGPQSASNSGPNSPLQADTNSRSSYSSETDDSYEWKQAEKLHSGFNYLKNSNVSVSHSGCNITKEHYNCSEYGKACGYMSYLKRQTGIQASEKPFSCSECGKGFGRKSSLITHLRIHTGQKRFVCYECGQTFGRKGNLLRHVRSHTGLKPFACPECDKRFGQKADLIKHLRIHTGQKPFGCSECDKTFGRKGHLITHMRIHTGEKPFSCSECGKRFGEKCSLNTHMKIHTGQKAFGCSECGKKFRQKGNLIRHMRIHTGEKPFGCSECAKKFGRKGHLITHMRIHTGEKPFGS